VFPLANDADPDGDALRISAVTSPTGGGTVDCTTFSDLCAYMAPAAAGTDSFTYTASDPYGATDTATVTITVLGNRAPDAADDAVTTPEDTPAYIWVLSNDTDPEGDVLNARGSGSGARGLGSFTCNGPTCEYTPKANVSGTDSFTYTVDDGRGGTDTGTVTVTVTPVNDAPSAVDDALTTDQGVAGTVAVLANDSDADGDGLSVATATPGAHGTVSCSPTGTCTYRPDAGFSGTDVFTYTVSDGHGGTDDGSVSVTIKPVEPPALTCRGRRATPTTVTTERGRRTVLGTDGPDVIIGTDAGETIRGMGGNDTICALGGDDLVEAGGGNDVVDAGTGADTVNGGDGNDTILGGEGDDVLLSGGGGNDTIDGGPGDDHIHGDGGNDLLDGGPGRDDISGGGGNDTIDGGPDADTCSGDAGHNSVTRCER
jgi:Ca2+-binding RTX toxin-like protein